ncbi:MAG: hypothetical protein LBR75_04915 [Prevotellaceae bacterium]|jgi:hypothetical protein|nr:hypothetical protein [Prevotellaceae bacterium]
MKNILILVFGLLILGSCNRQKGKTAEDFLQSAEQLQQSGDFANAKWQIDSLNALFPKNVKMRRAANTLLQKIELAEYGQSLTFLQGELQKQQSAADSLRKNFVLQQDEKYQTEGTFVHKSQASDGTLTRTMLKAFVAENGSLSFTCTVFGQSLCKFEALRVSAGDVFVETRPVAEDGAFNRNFNDGLYFWQTVTFRNENDAALLIAQNANKTVKVNTLGKCKTSFNMDKADKLAFKDAYYFSITLSEITRLKTEIVKAEKMIKHLQERLKKLNS